MEAAQSIVELVAAARVAAKTFEDRIADVQQLLGGQNGPGAQVEELRAATVGLETVAVDTFSAFEARMQHHFRRGPFSRKLRALLLEAGETDLANRVHQYYLAINVLKHGKGASHRELLNTPNSLFSVKPAQDATVEDGRPQTGMIDVSGSGFFDGLATTILEAYHFLENQ